MISNGTASAVVLVASGVLWSTALPAVRSAGAQQGRWHHVSPNIEGYHVGHNGTVAMGQEFVALVNALTVGGVISQSALRCKNHAIYPGRTTASSPSS